MFSRRQESPSSGSKSNPDFHTVNVGLEEGSAVTMGGLGSDQEEGSYIATEEVKSK